MENGISYMFWIQEFGVKRRLIFLGFTLIYKT